MLSGMDVFEFDSILSAVGVMRPDVVVNAIGLITPVVAAKGPISALTVNSLFPHRLAMLCRTVDARLIHISTDAVFSGCRGMYTENDSPDPNDFYGRSKLLGEVTEPHCLTFRTSIIGRDLTGSKGLVEWLLDNRGQSVVGYTKAIYSGFPSLVLAQIIADVIERHPELSGLYHVSSEPISKFELLRLLNDAYGADAQIKASDDVRINRSLDSSRFRAAIGFTPQPWPDMIKAMAADPTPYEKWRCASDS